MRKKILAAILAVTMVFGTGIPAAVDILPDTAVSVSAFTYGDFMYKPLEDGTAEITAYIGYDSEVVVPSEIGGRKVTSIGYYAFYYDKDVVSVTIPEGVTIVKDSAFSGCYQLESVTLPKSLETIEAYAFESCESLTSINIPDSVSSIGGCAFTGTPWLQKKASEEPLAIVNNILLAGYTCKGDVEIPKSVKSIADEAFMGNKELTGVTIPDTVTSIGDRVFAGCTSLTSITIPKSVTSIKRSAFDDTPWLENEIERSPMVIVNNILICGSGEGDIKIPDGVTSISDYAFSSDPDITGVTIPACVESIGEGAFLGCHELKSVKLEDGVKSIGIWAFDGCTSLTDITIPASVTSIGFRAFVDTPWLAKQRQADPLVIVNGILCDGQACKGDIEIPEGVTSITEWAFESNNDLTSVTIPDSVTDIKIGAFMDCENLKSVAIGGVRNIENGAFYNCPSLESLTLGSGIEHIDDGAFEECPKLKSVTIPDSVKWIGEYAFGYYWDFEIHEDVKIDGFTICCAKGTAGEQYAKENGFNYTLSAFAKGDVDRDGKINSADVIKVASHVKGTSLLTAEEQALADVTGDGKVDSADVVMLAAYVKGMKPSL